MTDFDNTCDRCEVTVTAENWGATLCDDWVGLERHDDVHLCENCRGDLEGWLEATPENNRS